MGAKFGARKVNPEAHDRRLVRPATGGKPPQQETASLGNSASAVVHHGNLHGSRLKASEQRSVHW